MTGRADGTTGRRRTGRRGGSTAPLLALVLLLALGGLAAWKMAGAPTDDDVWLDDVQAGLAAGAAGGRPVLVLFTADWCPACRRFERGVLADDEVEAALDAGFVRVKIDLSTRNGPNNVVASKLGVKAIPTLQVYDPDGHRLGWYRGAYDAGEFRHWLRACRSRMP